MELYKYEKRKRYKPHTLVRGVVRHRLLIELHSPTCEETCNGFELYDRNGNKLVGGSNLVVADEIVRPKIDIPTNILDVSANGTLISSLSEMILTLVNPPQDPTMIVEVEIVVPVPTRQTAQITAC